MMLAHHGLVRLAIDVPSRTVRRRETSSRLACSDDQDRQSYVPSTSHTFPIGARVLVDGRDEAIVAQVFPDGSTSLLAPHYCVRFVGGPPNEQVKVSMNRVGANAEKE